MFAYRYEKSPTSAAKISSDSLMRTRQAEILVFGAIPTAHAPLFPFPAAIEAHVVP
jgi:hypothetical protein